MVESHLPIKALFPAKEVLLEMTPSVWPETLLSDNLRYLPGTLYGSFIVLTLNGLNSLWALDAFYLEVLKQGH